MSSQAQSILFTGCYETQESTAPAAGITAKTSNDNVKKVDRRAIEQFLNSLADSVLPPLTLDDGSQPFNGDATNDWFYPGRSLRSGMLPDLDLEV